MYNAHYYNFILNRTTSVHVLVMDINDNSPEFTKSMYNFTLSESSETGTVVNVVSGTASDADSDENGRITYSLSGTSE